MIEQGMKAPEFRLPATGGGEVSLEDYAGQYLVIYFYPKDDTPGCTNEARDFTAHLDAFSAQGAQILGISRDPLAKHEAFREKHDIGIQLASDEDGSACEAYGVWVEKNMFGRKYMGIQRATFLIGPDRTVVRAWPRVRVKGHAQAVLEALRNAVATR
ncbi:MAG: redoxin domain-containing protein [Alphaproteobacteria bacterium]|jgi:peroxiredoxin Q/BCP|nr:redoxin domain-containing protein [Alphaproteobacteria bacterium]